MQTDFEKIIIREDDELIVLRKPSGFLIHPMNDSWLRDSQAALGQCHGVNACKGKGDCGGKGNECAGENSCEGKGWLKMPQSDCENVKNSAWKPMPPKA